MKMVTTIMIIMRRMMVTLVKCMTTKKELEWMNLNRIMLSA